MNVIIDSNAFMPTKAHSADAGFDIRTPIKMTVPAHGSAVIDTGVHFEIPAGYVGFIKSKSGLNVKHELQAEGVIDCGFTGSVVAKIYNHSDSDYTFERGDKITQIVFLPIPSVTLTQVEEFAETERGASGFGSSGR